MIIKLVGSGTELSDLETLVTKALTELALDDSVKVETTDDSSYKLELGITENPALAIEEESIDFRDMIFQGEVPAYDEIKSMFISILGDEEESGGSCGSGCGTGGCGSCGTEEEEGDGCGTGCSSH
ncbi:hypothetical protein K2X92_02985 [Candidatus Gracilibacteria bacterium]|nr:hypothetical protein [Candidatus Gracilibacteria bacterium]